MVLEVLEEGCRDGSQGKPPPRNKHSFLPDLSAVKQLLSIFKQRPEMFSNQAELGRLWMGDGGGGRAQGGEQGPPDQKRVCSQPQIQPPCEDRTEITTVCGTESGPRCPLPLPLRSSATYMPLG
jgi:hypothetical protein